MFGLFGTKNSKENILVIDLYKSYINLTFVHKKQDDVQLVSAGAPLNYLHTQEPKLSLWESNFESLFDTLYQKLLTETNQKIRNIDKIIILPHTSSAKIRMNEFYIKLDEKINLSESAIINLVKQHANDKEALIERIQNSDYKKHTRLIVNVLPNYYRLKKWRERKVDKFSILLADNYIQADIFEILRKILNVYTPKSKILILHPVLFYSDSKPHLRTFIDIGAEEIGIYQIYKSQVISHNVVNISFNSLVRNISKMTGESFELAKSELHLYLKGKGNSLFSSRIEELLSNFRSSMENELNSMDIKKVFMGDVIAIYNPDLQNETLLWLLNAISSTLDPSIKYKLLKKSKQEKYYKNALRLKPKDEILII